LNLLNDRRKYKGKETLSSQEILRISNIYQNFTTYGESKHWEKSKVGSSPVATRYPHMLYVTMRFQVEIFLSREVINQLL